MTTVVTRSRIRCEGRITCNEKRGAFLSVGVDCRHDAQRLQAHGRRIYTFTSLVLIPLVLARVLSHAEVLYVNMLLYIYQL